MRDRLRFCVSGRARAAGVAADRPAQRDERFGGSGGGERMGNWRERCAARVPDPRAGGQTRRRGAFRRGICGDRRLLQFESYGASRADGVTGADARVPPADFGRGRNAGARRFFGGAAPRVRPLCGRPAPSGLDLSACEGMPRSSCARRSRRGIRRSGHDFFEDSAEAAKFLANFVAPQDLLLIKGSRGVKMEKILEAIDAGHPRAMPGPAAKGRG